MAELEAPEAKPGHANVARLGQGSISDKEKSLDRCDRVEADEFTH